MQLRLKPGKEQWSGESPGPMPNGYGISTSPHFLLQLLLGGGSAPAAESITASVATMGHSQAANLSAMLLGNCGSVCVRSNSMVHPAAACFFVSEGWSIRWQETAETSIVPLAFNGVLTWTRPSLLHLVFRQALCWNGKSSVIGFDVNKTYATCFRNRREWMWTW